MSLRFCIIGAGKLATQLAINLKKANFVITQIYSRTSHSAAGLAKKVESSFITDIKLIDISADVFVIALSDSVIGEVLSKTVFHNKLLIHCSGSLPLSVIKGYSAKTGVIYPLQTLSKNRFVSFKNVPLFIEANSKETEQELLKIARKLSENVSVLASDKRMILHISAVFACNFVNYMYTVAADLLQCNGIEFDTLRPLILETAQKVMDMHPIDAQTGPAVRFDKNIIESHLEALTQNDGYRELYMSISKSIFELHKKQIQ
ncbi:MAG: NADP oxidoreductase [Draconibacterium sp.]|nr:MAG: NADP oxidoreductase [Draconibacterium sp.]